MGYSWMIVRDDDVEDLAVGINTVSEQLAIEGYGDRLLCAVFGFQDAQGAAMYFIYNYKRGTWYPFIPAPGEQQRSTERELRMKAVHAADPPTEPEPHRLFPPRDHPNRARPPPPPSSAPPPSPRAAAPSARPSAKS